MGADLAATLTTLLSVIMLNIVLSGDNAVVVAMAAAGLPPEQQRRVIMAGIGIAFVLRVLFSLVAVRLLEIVGLLLVGGLLLLWVAWKMWRDIRHEPEATLAEGAVRGGKTMRAAILQITLADVSMSLDNVLAVAGAARDNFPVLVFGLLLSIALMGLAASFIARLLERWKWLSYVGLLFILYVAVTMIWDGGSEVVGRMS